MWGHTSDNKYDTLVGDIFVSSSDVFLTPNQWTVLCQADSST